MEKKISSLLATSLFGVLNDNFLKTVTCFLIINWLPKEIAGIVVSVAAGSLVLPFIFLSPLAGVVARKYERRKVVRWGKWAEIPIVILAIIGFALNSIWLPLVAILLMGVQSCMFSPAKYGLIKDIVGEEKLSRGVGMMEGVAFLGMLTGTVFASFMVASEESHNYIYILLILVAILGLLTSYCIPETSVMADNSKINFREIRPIQSLIDNWKLSRKYEGITRITIVLSVFWWLAASIQIGLLVYCQETMGLNSIQTGILLTFAAIGISTGSVMSGYFFKTNYKFLSVVTSAVIISASSLLIFFIELPYYLFGLVIFITSMAGGFFKVPLDTNIQLRVNGNFLSIVLAMFNQVSFIFILFASLNMSLISLFLETSYLFLVIGVVFFITTLYVILHKEITL